MPVLTKQDLEDWNAHPVTKMIFKEIKKAQTELAMESALCSTSDETAMRTAYNDGVIMGSNTLMDYYYIMLEESE